MKDIKLPSEEMRWKQFYASGYEEILQKDFPQKTLWKFLESGILEDNNQHDALVYFGRRISRKELVEQVHLWARVIKGMGLDEGDEVLLFGPSFPEFIYIMLAADMTGITANLPNLMVKPEALESMVGKSRVAFVFDGLEKPIRKTLQNPQFEHVVILSATPLLGLLKFGLRFKAKYLTADAAIRRFGKYEGPLETEPVKGKAAYIFCSSGTSGQGYAKQIGMSDEAMIAMCRNALAFNLKGDPCPQEGRSYCQLPPFVCTGFFVLVMAPLYRGMTVYLDPRMSARRFATNILTIRPQITLATGANWVYLTNQLDRLIQKGKRPDLSCFTFPVMGVPVPVLLKNHLDLKFDASVEGKIYTGLKYEFASEFEAGLKYDGRWHTIANGEIKKNELSFITPRATIHAETGVGLYFCTDVLIGGVAGPTASIGPKIMGEMDMVFAPMEKIPFKFDCVVTTDSRRKRTAIMTMLEENPVANCENMTVTVTRNVGRDVAPFFAACSELIDQYDFIGHFHTKKSMTVNWGHEWRHYLLDQLLGSPETVASIFRRFDRDPHIGLYFPSPIPTMRDYMNWEKNLARCVDLLNAMGLPSNLPPNPDFPVGQMFWARTKAIAPLFREGIVDQAKFEEENYQISDTLAHAIERIWKYVAQGAGYTALSAIVPPPIPPEKKAEPGEEKEYVKRLAIFVHYSADQKVSPADMYLLNELKKCADIVFVSNSGLIQESMKKVSRIAAKVITRENVGYDFGAWRDALEETRLTGYDELVLLNNSVYGPMYSFQEIFARMSSNPADFWGMTEFPETDNPRREEAKWLPNGIIPRHIQSYFLVFRQQVFSSEAFKEFWRNVKNETSLPAVVANYETRLSSKLEKAGFKSDVYLRAAARLQEVDKITPEFNAIYCRPQDFLVLGFPFLKKNICYYQKQPEINETIHLISRLYQYPTNFIKITAKTR